MPKLKKLSGQEIVSIFSLFGFNTHSQRGSHIKLRKVLSDGSKQTLTIPNHKEIALGTTRVIFRQALTYIPEDQLKKHFYTD